MLWWVVAPDAISAHDVSIKILHRFRAEHGCPRLKKKTCCALSCLWVLWPTLFFPRRVRHGKVTLIQSGNRHACSEEGQKNNMPALVSRVFLFSQRFCFPKWSFHGYTESQVCSCKSLNSRTTMRGSWPLLARVMWRRWRKLWGKEGTATRNRCLANLHEAKKIQQGIKQTQVVQKAKRDGYRNYKSYIKPASVSDVWCQE